MGITFTGMCIFSVFCVTETTVQPVSTFVLRNIVPVMYSKHRFIHSWFDSKWLV